MKKVPNNNYDTVHEWQKNNKSENTGKSSIEQKDNLPASNKKQLIINQYEESFTNAKYELGKESPLKRTTIPGTYILIEAKYYNRDENKNVKRLIIPDYITEISEKVFYAYSELEEIEFLADKVRIGDCAFPPNNKIKRIKGKQMYISITAFRDQKSYENYIYEDIIIYYGFALKIDSCFEKYKNIFEIEIDEKNIYKYLYYEDPFVKKVMQEILINFPEDRIMADLISIYDEKNFLKNLELLKSVNNGQTIFSEQSLVKIFINNPNFFQYSIEDSLIDNYMYLLSQTIIPEIELQELYFGIKQQTPLVSTELYSGKKTKKEIVQIILKEYYVSTESTDLPELFQTLVISPELPNKLELFDRLTYVETMGLLTSKRLEDHKNAIRMLQRTNYENIVEVDKIEFSEETKSIYDSTMDEMKIFDAIRLSFYDKINGINKSIFPLFVEQLNDNSKNSIMNNFLNSLTTIKNWNKFTDLKQRATFLKNEIIARLLYGMLKKSDINQNSSEQDLLTQMRKDFSSITEILKDMTGQSSDVFKEEKYITLMLKIDPYSFDAFRSYTDNPSDLECKYWVHARENNYLFTKEETKRYYDENTKAIHPRNYNRLAFLLPRVRHTDTNEIKDIREYINNEIGMPKISEKNKEAYLRKVRELARSYIRKNTDEDLLAFLKSIDLYMRSSNEYAIQQHDEERETTSLLIFDKNSDISKENRLLYILYNLNQLAHSTTERNLLYDVHHRYRIDANEEKNEGNVLKKLITYISELMQHGLSYEDILIISEGKRNIDFKILGINSSSDEYLVDYLNDSCIQSEIVVPITINNIAGIKEKFKYLNDNLYLNNRLTKVKNYAQERFTFFETKRIIADELIRKFSKGIDGEIIEIAFASKEEKQQFFARTGLIVEIQTDESNHMENNQTIVTHNPVLVCYSEQFNETFSIHLKELDKKYLDRFYELVQNNQLVETISNTALKPPGLSLRKPEMRKKKNNSSIPRLEGKFIARGGNREIDYAIAFYNYFTFDVERIKYQNKEKINNLKELLHKENLTTEEIIMCRRELDALVKLKNSKYYNRFVNTENELRQDYEKIFGYEIPEDVFGIDSIQEELKLLHQKLLIHLLKHQKETQQTFRI